MIHNEYIQQVTKEIIEYCHPNKIILFSWKHNVKDELSSFKLIVIADHSEGLSHDLYLNIDCEIPFDLVVYSTTQWEELSHTQNSLAERAIQKGVVLYG